MLDTLIPGSSESGAGLQTNKYWGVVLTSSHGKEGQRDNTAWLTPWHAGLVSLAGKKSPYVSRHQLVAVGISVRYNSKQSPYKVVLDSSALWIGACILTLPLIYSMKIMFWGREWVEYNSQMK